MLDARLARGAVAHPLYPPTRPLTKWGSDKRTSRLQPRSHSTNWTELNWPKLIDPVTSGVSRSCAQSRSRHADLLRTDWLRTQQTRSRVLRTAVRIQTLQLVCTCCEFEFTSVRVMWTRLASGILRLDRSRPSWINTTATYRPTPEMDMGWVHPWVGLGWVAYSSTWWVG